MEKPDAATIAWYNAAIPDDPRAIRSQMFGFPCSFVHGNMFFGTFAASVVARVGSASVAARVAAGQGTIFEPMPGRAWKEYVQIATGAVDDAAIAAIAAEALAFTAALPPKPEKAAKGKGKKAG